MCITRPECQRCETCGKRKYQLWASREMHDRGCPWGYDRMDRCPDAVNHAKTTYWGRENGVEVSERGLAYIEQMLAAGVDLTQPIVDFVP